MINKAIQKAVVIAGSQQKLAVLCGVSQPTVWRWVHGGGIENRFIKKIVKATNGKVRAQDIDPHLAELLQSS